MHVGAAPHTAETPPPSCCRSESPWSAPVPVTETGSRVNEVTLIYDADVRLYLEDVKLLFQDQHGGFNLPVELTTPQDPTCHLRGEKESDRHVSSGTVFNN